METRQPQLTTHMALLTMKTILPRSEGKSRRISPRRNFMKQPRRILVIALTLFLASFSQAQDLEPHLQKGLKTIRAMDAYHYVKKMVSPEFGGRYTGDEGYLAAANWAAKKFKEWGLEPMNKTVGYLQAFPAPYTKVKEAELTLMLQNGRSVTLTPEEDFLPMLPTDSGHHAAGAVFAGWGVHAPEMNYDDYHGLDVRGKYVLCIRGVPDPDNPAFKPHNEHRHRMKTAKEKGALGLFYIYEPHSNPNMDWIEGFTSVILSEKSADLLLEEKGFRVAELKQTLLKYQRPISFELAGKISYRVVSEFFPEGTGYNVVGIIEGSDSRLKTECIVIGGHYDHNGTHLGILFPGANDNASGSAAVVEIAEAFAHTGKRPKRSVVFVLFGGEEMGLKGSHFFVDHIPEQFSKVDAMYNLDMVGDGRKATGRATTQPPEFKKSIWDADKHVRILGKFGDITGPGGGSDYRPFNDKGIPCAALMSDGPGLHYHRSADDIYNVNPDIMAEIAKLVYIASYRWADR
ncbi:MAG: M20/M25/M40 family metallo-hydrolase [Acidobacteriota bacterium]|nr:M20/M25/M40 family metallo-hydrolase [Acidobacteriota bacterium]